jgi:osmotically inducible protein OsmC
VAGVPTSLEASVIVQLELLDEGFTITGVEIEVSGEAPGIDQAAFIALAEETKRICPVLNAQAATPITLSFPVS